MEKFRVPQRKVPARVCMRDGREVRGALYVPAGGPGGGPGSLTSRLAETNERFLPFAGAEGGSLLSKRWITSVHLRREDAAPELPDPPPQHEVRVRMTLAGGNQIVGTVSYSMPPEKGRLIDFLNAAPRFVLVRRADEIALINRDHILEAERADSA